jgi:hypothetical protein
MFLILFCLMFKISEVLYKFCCLVTRTLYLDINSCISFLHQGIHKWCSLWKKYGWLTPFLPCDAQNSRHCSMYLFFSHLSTWARGLVKQINCYDSKLVLICNNSDIKPCSICCLLKIPPGALVLKVKKKSSLKKAIFDPTRSKNHT